MAGSDLRRPAVAALLALAVVGPAAGAGAVGLGRPASAPPRPTLRLAELNAPSLDPALASSPDAVMVQNALCARLYSPSGPGGAVVPQIATAFPAAAPDPQRPRQWTTYRIVLRAGYRFQDGTPVTAYSFAETFARLADPDQGSPAALELAPIVGAAAVEQSEASGVSGVDALNARTLEISTLKPQPKLAAMLAEPYFCPVEEDTPVSSTGLPYPPGAGAYRVAANGPGEIVFERNPYYRGADRPPYASITLRTGVGFDACRRDVARGTVDICLDALPQRQDSVPLAALVVEGWVSRAVGCLRWERVVRLDLAALCPAR